MVIVTAHNGVPVNAVEAQHEARNIAGVSPLSNDIPLTLSSNIAEYSRLRLLDKRKGGHTMSSKDRVPSACESLRRKASSNRNWETKILLDILNGESIDLFNEVS